MKITLSWLSKYLETEASIIELVDKLTSIGLEVEGTIGNASFVIVTILEVLQHPNADKLSLCKVSDGNKILHVISGASNVRQNMKTVLATADSLLPRGNQIIKPTRMRGILSEGMLCSAYELALTEENSAGIIELPDDYMVGANFFNHDPTIDINVTPNRGDCLSVYGIARDLAATGIGVLRNYSNKNLITETINSPIKIETFHENSFVSGRYIANIVNGESPQWLRDRLESVGMRSISTVVDVINYITLSFGRPMHAYDADKIYKKLTVRRASNGEIFTALNGKKYLLDNNITIVSDNSHIHAIAGIIGGKYSECTLDTTNIFLESAWFDSLSIIKSSRQLNISTDSSYRFSRSVDPNFVVDGLNLATQMIVDLCGGQISNLLSVGGVNSKNSSIDFNYQDVNSIGSVDLTSDEVSNILTKLGFKIDEITNNHWTVHVPSWRRDVTISVDLVEEVLRIYGYNKIQEIPLVSNVKVVPNMYSDVRTLILSRGFNETLTWSFMSNAVAKKFGYSDTLFTIANPLNENLNIMRPIIIPNLLQVVINNTVYGTSDLAIFEIGPIYNNDTTYEQNVLSGIRAGNNLPRNHYKIDREVDVFDAKADFISVLEFFSIDCDDVTIEKTDKQYYHPGKSGLFSYQNIVLGYFGELHPSILDFFCIKQRVVAFEVILDNIKNLPINQNKFIDYKYQNVKRDFAFVISKDVNIGMVIKVVKKSSKLIRDVLVFDIYCGNNIEPNKISVALSVTFCSSVHTLTEEEIQKESGAIIESMRNIGGVLRT